MMNAREAGSVLTASGDHTGMQMVRERAPYA